MANTPTDLAVEARVTKVYGLGIEEGKKRAKLEFEKLLKEEIDYWQNSLKEGNWGTEANKGTWFAAIAAHQRVLKKLEEVQGKTSE